MHITKLGNFGFEFLHFVQKDIEIFELFGTSSIIVALSYLRFEEPDFKSDSCEK